MPLAASLLSRQRPASGPARAHEAPQRKAAMTDATPDAARGERAEAGSSHHHGAHDHPVHDHPAHEHAIPAHGGDDHSRHGRQPARAAGFGVSLLRLSLMARLAIVAGLLAPLWVAVFFVVGGP